MLNPAAISRRAFTLGVGAGLLERSASAAPIARKSLAFVGDGGRIKGVGTGAPIANWGAASYGLNARRIAALHNAGFNTIRVFVSLREFLAAQTPNANPTADEVTERWIAYVRHGVAAGFRVLVSWDSSYDDRLAICGGGDVAERFSRALADLSRGLAKSFAPSSVALELMNEPPEETRLKEIGAKPWTTVCAPRFFADVRRGAPELAVVVQSASGGWSETIPDFDLAAFDDNTMFCFHFYIPGEFTHQGIKYPDFYGVPFPVTRYLGGKRRMLSDILSRLASDPQLGAAEKQKLEANYRGVIDYLWYGDAPLDRSWVKWPKLDKWIAAKRVDPARLLCGEFGVDGAYNFNGAPGADLLSRANYMRAVRENVESRGFGGWIAHQAMGDFNLFEQSSINHHGDTLIPELVQALFH